MQNSRILLAVVAAATLAFCLPVTAQELPPSQPVVVIGVGEILLAGQVEAILESRLREHGVEVFDERGLLELDELLGDRSRTLPYASLELLRPHARTLVLVRAEYLGDRPLYYMRRRDAAFTSRLFVTVIDLETEEPGESLVNQKVEYTHASVERVAERAVASKLKKLVETLTR